MASNIEIAAKAIVPIARANASSWLKTATIPNNTKPPTIGKSFEAAAFFGGAGSAIMC
jgi:hypothetical protein